MIAGTTIKPIANSDEIILQQTIKINSIQDSANNYKKSSHLFMIVSLILLMLVLLITGSAIYGYSYIQKQSIEVIESNRLTLIQGLYTTIKSIDTAITSREKRIEIYTKNAKRIILEHNAKTDFTDNDMSEMIKLNWELSELKMVNPYLYLAYNAAESDFTKGAKSKWSNASGCIQVMPQTMKYVLGSRYIPGMEFDPLWSCRFWYEYVPALSESVGNDIVWTACAYMSLHAIAWKAQGRTPEDFMKWIVETTKGNNSDYPFKIRNYYEKYIGM
jgi:hypothetical protein